MAHDLLTDKITARASGFTSGPSAADSFAAAYTKLNTDDTFITINVEASVGFDEMQRLMRLYQQQFPGVGIKFTFKRASGASEEDTDSTGFTPSPNTRFRASSPRDEHERPSPFRTIYVDTEPMSAEKARDYIRGQFHSRPYPARKQYHFETRTERQLRLLRDDKWRRQQDWKDLWDFIMYRCPPGVRTETHLSLAFSEFRLVRRDRIAFGDDKLRLRDRYCEIYCAHPRYSCLYQ